MAFVTRDLVIGIIIGLAVGAVLGYIMAPKVDTTQLEQRISQLEEQVSIIQGQIAQVGTQTGQMSESLTSLEYECSVLNSSLGEMQELVAAQESWHEVIDIYEETGTAETKYSPIFHIRSDRWRVKWHFYGTEFLGFWVRVYQKGISKPVAQFGEITWERIDTIDIDIGPGDFYLEIWVPSPELIHFYEITVEAYY